jgi:flagellar biosynthesis protein FlhA
MATVTTAPATNAAAIPPLRAMLRTGLGLPVGVLAALAMVVLPLPPIALDALFTFNIALSIVVVMAVFYVARPIEFGVFPTVLLLATLLRLALNVASTRVVLLNGHTGTQAAGRVIQSFGEFVIGGNLAVGVVVFVILTVINFVVVTKGSGRISEVSARFTLDAMPGKQMAIDADLNAGLITQDEARTRRVEVRTEADFYGSMDGASKFVRGDAVAGILILFINIIGGLSIGTVAHGLPFSQAVHTYTLLTIGDGLVTQIPALLLSTAVAVIVTRMSGAQDMGGELGRQLFRQPKALGVAAGLLATMGLVPGMPNLAFLTMAALCGFGAYWMRKRQAAQKPAPKAAAASPAPENRELSWEDVQPVDVLGLEVGYRLVPLVNKAQNGDLLARVRGVRRKLSQELGFLVPAVHIRDNLDLAPNAYRINLGGVPVGESVVYPEREMAINPGRVFGQLKGIATRDPAFGMDAVWIEPAAREHAQTLGYTVVDASTVVATHLSHIIQMHAHELLGHDEVQQLLNTLAKNAPKLIEDLIPKVLPLSVVVRVLQGLLAERVPIRNIRAIIETLSEHAARTPDPAALQSLVRTALGRQIVQDIVGISGELPVITLEPELERLLQNSLSPGSTSTSPGLEPGLAERLQQRLSESVQRQELSGEPAVLLVPPQLRATLARFIRSSVPNLHVLAWNEIPDNRKVRLVSAVGH